MANFLVKTTFRDEHANKWYKQGEIIELAVETAKNLLIAGVITPILESLMPKKKVETADKKLGTEKAVK